MRVHFDITALDHERLSGVGVYAYNLMKSLEALTDFEVLPVWRMSRVKRARFFSRYSSGKARPYARLFGFRDGIFHGPDFRLPTWLKIPRVVTIHDLAFLKPGMTSLEFSEKKKQELIVTLDLARPDAIIAVSEATRKDLLEFRPSLEKIVHVVHSGADHMSRDLQTAPVPGEPEDPYFLFVGNLEARKNVAGLIRAFEIFRENGGDKRAKLVLVGKPGYQGREIVAQAAASPARDHIEFKGFLRTADLANLYRKAIALVYPSWIEGFGFPLLEAMSLNCPVITANASATAEVAGSAAMLVDPASSDAIAGAMQALREDAHLRAALSEAGAKRLKQFRWSECARKTAEVYARVI